MKRRFALCALVSALAGCNSEYSYDEIATSFGSLGTPDARYVVIKSGEPLTGTVVPREGGRVLQPFKVEDGKVVGPWKAYDEKGRLVEGQLQAGMFVGAKKTWCPGENPSHLQSVSTLDNDRRSLQDYDCASGLQVRDSTILLADATRKHSARVGEQRTWQVINGEQKLTLLETFAADGSDKLEGLVEHYNYQGVLVDRATYKNGALDGVFESWSAPEGKPTVPATKLSYSAGKKNGPAETYFVSGWPAGTIAEKGEYKDDRKAGVWLIYGPGHVSVLDYDKPQNESVMAERLAQAARGETRTIGAPRMVYDLDSFAYLQKSSGIDINQWLTSQSRPLITLAADNAYDYLISAGADPKRRDIQGNTRLMTCLAGIDFPSCSLEHMNLLAASEDLKEHNVYGYTPLALFCSRADQLHGNSRENPQAQALFQTLLKGSDVNAAAYGGETALHACMSQRNHGYAEALVAAGANLDAVDLDGTTPLAAAFMEQYRGSKFSRIQWSEEVIRFVAGYQGKSQFTFDTPVPAFGMSVRQMVLENGDTKTARLIDSLVGTAKG